MSLPRPGLMSLLFLCRAISAGALLTPCSFSTAARRLLLLGGPSVTAAVPQSPACLPSVWQEAARHWPFSSPHHCVAYTKGELADLIFERPKL
ncbi:hypothetical protein B0T26DRAFT_700257 [Lasiosphaeria miniovina]|uniref:Secreted protein n=1 Tax=Lasiosphaeria miniovina TaxID=1954250 RepID=A0AA40ATR7_9PEZI|nr:uncharacterized protein B0T26DRAFT_700257 [Lasiosphaeria miniovina]KAK0721769.1 hypothetical protein B0T26DRAFT_700257 [Lasiosphaeria miniovina]